MKNVFRKVFRTRSFRFIIMLLSLGTFWGGASPIVQAADAQWSATYWNNRDLSGSAVLQRSENSIDYDWGHGSPNQVVNNDQFSVRWTRRVYFDAGSYRFTATMDDGMRVWVDGALIIDSWTDSQEHSLSYDAYLNTGDHDIKVEYYDAGGVAIARLSWAGIGGPSPVPIGNWKGEYFNNRTLSGTPVLVRDDVRIDFDWGVGSPSNVVFSDQFSVRWTRNLSLQPARYRFTAIVDDGVRLWVNNRLIIDQWHDAGTVTYSGEIDLAGGSIPVRMEYYENSGGAVARLAWSTISGGNWRGEYFNNRTLSGSPALVRDDANVSFNWGSGSPATGINADSFSVRWTRVINLVGGRYRFTATSDDGVRVYVDGQLVVNGWNDQQPTTFNGERDLTSGDHTIVVEYYDYTGGAQIDFSFNLFTPPQTPPPPPLSGAVGTVLVNRLNVRNGPGLNHTILGQLSRGDVVPLAGFRSQDSRWVMINWSGGTAWVSSLPVYLETNVLVEALPVWQQAPQEPSPVQAEGSATIGNCFLLNMRAGPGVSYAILDSLPRGTVVQLLGRNSGSSWAKVRLASGAEGWMSTRYLISNMRFSSLPIVS